MSQIFGGGPMSQIFRGGVPCLRFFFGGWVPGLRFWGGGPRSQIFWGGSQVSDFWGGPRSQMFGGGRYPVSVKGKIFDTRLGLIHVQTRKKNFFVEGPPTPSKGKNF